MRRINDNIHKMSRYTLSLYLLGSLAYFIPNTVAKLQGEGILGGNLANLDQFPYQVAVVEPDGGELCGGGIIDDEYILTAGHCVMNDKTGDFTGKPLTVIAGINDLDNDSAILIPVKKVYVHKEFNATSFDLENDIAVLKLQWSLNISQNANLKKLELPTDPNENYDNEEAIIAGFGFDFMDIIPNPLTNQLEEEGENLDYQLKYLVTKVVDEVKCRSRYTGERQIFYSQVCAKAIRTDPQNPSGVCSGDSGGPLVHKNKTIIGIVSNSPFGCNEVHKPGVYTRVSSYLDFINNAKKDNVTNDMLALEL